MGEGLKTTSYPPSISRANRHFLREGLFVLRRTYIMKKTNRQHNRILSNGATHHYIAVGYTVLWLLSHVSLVH